MQKWVWYQRDAILIFCDDEEEEKNDKDVEE